MSFLNTCHRAELYLDPVLRPSSLSHLAQPKEWCWTWCAGPSCRGLCGLHEHIVQQVASCSCLHIGLMLKTQAVPYLEPVLKVLRFAYTRLLRSCALRVCMRVSCMQAKPQRWIECAVSFSSVLLVYHLPGLHLARRARVSTQSGGHIHAGGAALHWPAGSVHELHHRHLRCVSCWLCPLWDTCACGRGQGCQHGWM